MRSTCGGCGGMWGVGGVGVLMSSHFYSLNAISEVSISYILYLYRIHEVKHENSTNKHHWEDTTLPITVEKRWKRYSSHALIAAL